jgi:hypothetical protein
VGFIGLPLGGLEQKRDGATQARYFNPMFSKMNPVPARLAVCALWRRIRKRLFQRLVKKVFLV